MIFYKIINISDNKVLNVAKDNELIFIKSVGEDLVAIKNATKSKPCGFILSGKTYFLENTDYPSNLSYPVVATKIIGLKEYSDLKALFTKPDDRSSGIVDSEYASELADTIETARSIKEVQLSDACKQAIFAGVDVVFDNYNTKHFDLTLEDQLNLNTLRYQLLTTLDNKFAYHSKGNSFEYFTRKEIEAILLAMDAHILYHNSYFNSLKNYIKTLTDINTIVEIKYGDDFPDIYKSSVLLDIIK